MYDGDSNQWLPVAPLNRYCSVSEHVVINMFCGSRRAYLAVTECKGRIYAIGGFDGKYMNSVERYDPERDVWEPVASMKVERSSAAAVCCEGKIYVMGGWNGIACRTIECYDPAHDSWQLACTMEHDRIGLCCALHLPQSRIDEETMVTT